MKAVLFAALFVLVRAECVVTMEAMLSYGDERCEYWKVVERTMLSMHAVNCSNHGQKWTLISNYGILPHNRLGRAFSQLRDELLYTTGFDITSRNPQFVDRFRLEHVSDKCDDFVLTVAGDGAVRIPNCDDGHPDTDDSYDAEHGCINKFPVSEEDMAFLAECERLLEAGERLAALLML